MSEKERPVDPQLSNAGGASPAVPPAQARTLAPSDANTTATSKSSVATSCDPSASGFYSTQTPIGRLSRLWANLGLLLGRRLATAVRDDHIFLIVMAAFVGITSGAAAGLLLKWIDFAIASFPTAREGDTWVRWLALMGVPVVGGLVVGGLRLFAQRVARVPLAVGTPAVIESVAKHGGVLHGRSGLITGLGTGLTIGSGGSCGHEGPSIAIGATVGSVVSGFFGLRRRRRMAMVGAGCAGGLAAAFNAPLAGVIFTVEVVFGGSIGGDVGSMSVFIPLIVAAVCGTFTSYGIRGQDLEFGLPVHASPSPTELIFYVALAVAAGVVGTVMNKMIIASSERFANWRAPVWVKPAAGAAGVGLLAALVSNELLGTGHSTVEHALYGGLEWKLAAALLVLKLVTTALTLGSGGFGGAFMPALYVGACLGTLVGTGAHLLIDGAQPVGAYAAVGMGAIFAATMHAPLTPIVVLFELTHDYGIILPLMLACILAGVVARRLNRQSLFALELRHRGVVLNANAEDEVMKRGLVKELMVAPGPVLPESAELPEIRRAAMDAELRAVFVVNESNAVIGYINGNQLAKRMLAGDIHEASDARAVMATTNLPLLFPGDTLAGAILASARSGMETLPVVDEAGCLIGVLRRGDLLAHYSDNVLAEREEVVQVRTGRGAVADEEVGLGKGLVLERLSVGPLWAGRSLAQLELRGKTGVTVLEWCRGDDTLPVDPHRPLARKDVLAIVGSREQILRARLLR